MACVSTRLRDTKSRGDNDSGVAGNIGNQGDKCGQPNNEMRYTGRRERSLPNVLSSVFPQVPIGGGPRLDLRPARRIHRLNGNSVSGGAIERTFFHQFTASFNKRTIWTRDLALPNSVVGIMQRWLILERPIKPLKLSLIQDC